MLDVVGCKQFCSVLASNGSVLQEVTNKNVRLKLLSAICCVSSFHVIFASRLASMLKQAVCSTRLTVRALSVQNRTDCFRIYSYRLVLHRIKNPG